MLFGVVAKLPKLKRLYLTRTNTKDEGLKHLEGKESLELLDLNHCNLVTIEGLKAVATLKNLKSLNTSLLLEWVGFSPVLG